MVVGSIKITLYPITCWEHRICLVLFFSPTYFRILDLTFSFKLCVFNFWKDNEKL
jgi:hypothetical protein